MSGPVLRGLEMFTVSVLLPGPERQVARHELFDDRASAVDEIGRLALEAPPGSVLILRDPDGNDVMRLERRA